MEEIIFEGKPVKLHYIGHYIFLVIGFIILISLPSIYAKTGYGFFYLFFLAIPIPLFVWLDRKQKKYLVTSTKIIVKKGLIAKRIDEIAVSDIRYLNVTQTILGSIFKYGNISIGTAGYSGLEIKMEGLPNPVEIKDKIQNSRNIKSK